VWGGVGGEPVPETQTLSIDDFVVRGQR
jgi:hypothetical protein